MARTVSWDLTLDGQSHVLTHTAGFLRKRADHLVLDGVAVPIAWRRTSPADVSIPRRLVGYRAELDIAGHPAVVDWRSVSRPESARESSIGALIIGAVGVLGGSFASSSTMTESEIALTVDGQTYGSRTS
jgi:hypothetical protein